MEQQNNTNIPEWARGVMSRMKNEIIGKYQEGHIAVSRLLTSSTLDVQFWKSLPTPRETWDYVFRDGLLNKAAFIGNCKKYPIEVFVINPDGSLVFERHDPLDLPYVEAVAAKEDAEFAASGYASNDLGRAMYRLMKQDIQKFREGARGVLRLEVGPDHSKADPFVQIIYVYDECDDDHLWQLAQNRLGGSRGELRRRILYFDFCEIGPQGAISPERRLHPPCEETATPPQKLFYWQPELATGTA